jgi:acetylornithine/N-succinyldiaminopimelate aminotransferase
VRAGQLHDRLDELAWGHGCPGVRNAGLLCALELPQPAAESVRDLCFEHGLLLNAPRPHLLRLMPSLRVTAAEVDEMARILGQCLSQTLASAVPSVSQAS